MKKSFGLSIVLTSCLMLLSACGSSTGGSTQSTQAPASSEKPASTAEQAPKDDFPNRPINIIVPWSAGGGTDVSARTLAPYVEKELGVTINVVNKPGGGGWVGLTEIAQAKPDGYTLGITHSPTLPVGFVDPNAKRDISLDSYSIVAHHVIDPDVVAIRADDTRFSDIKGLIEYAKKEELTTTATAIGSDEHLVALDFNKNYGTKFNPVQFKGAADSYAAALGGHVDIFMGNLSELLNMHKEGQIKILGIATDERSSLLPDVPTLTESGFDVKMASSRGIGGPKGIDAHRLEILEKAFEKAIKNEEQIKKIEDMGAQVQFMGSQDYLNMLKENVEKVKNLGDLLGW
ncbi:tripartite tricarboxylate transporter substrate binding protein [Ammoniphilus resinae]|nr:tripartite tricarboxylate transporter substrate binding protein [Ammoniphilus resinae]